MENQKWTKYFRSLKTKLQSRDNLDLRTIEKAFYFAAHAHRKQKRKSGEYYIIHPVAVAEIVFSLDGDTETIISALLHDTVEDTEITLEDIRYHFGATVAFIINGMTKIIIPKTTSYEEKIAINMQRLFIAMKKDMRIVILKISDRLHNMQTMASMKPEKQEMISKETLSIYVPLAKLLGIKTLKKQLEDLCFHYIKPQEFQEIEKYKKEHIKKHQKFPQEIKEYLSDFGIKSTVTLEDRGTYKTYKKIKKNTKNLFLYPHWKYIQIVIPENLNPYEVLEKIHAEWTPLYGTFRDYIARKSNNFYNALHTVIIGNNNSPIRIKIMTKGMQKTSETGYLNRVFSHNKYIQHSIPNWLSSIFQLIEIEKNPLIIYKEICTNIFGKNLQCTLTNGQSLSLQEGSTGIDILCKEKKDLSKKWQISINGEICRLKTQINKGDIIETIENPKGEKLSSSFFLFAKDFKSKLYIKKFISKLPKKEIQEQGKKLILFITNTLQEKKDTQLSAGIKKLYKEYFKQKLEKSLYSIGSGEIELQAFHNHLISLKKYNSINMCALKDRSGFFQEILSSLKKSNINVLFAEGGTPLIKRKTEVTCRIYFSETEKPEKINRAMIKIMKLRKMGHVFLSLNSNEDQTLSSSFLEDQNF